MRHKPKLGQNFLIDVPARRSIVDALGDISRRTVIEIGPGRGALTEILAARCGRLLALELDRELAARLRQRFSPQAHVEIIEMDVLRADLAGFAAPGQTLDVVGNLPYYITSEILLRLFAAGAGGARARAVVMVQREVAERLAAQPGTRAYGLLSATAQMTARVESLFTLPPGAFAPPPEVSSTVVRMEFAPRFAELGVDREGFDGFLRQSFAQKRKTLQNNLRAAGYSIEQIAEAWPSGVSEQARAEAVSLEAMASLYRGLRQAPLR